MTYKLIDSRFGFVGDLVKIESLPENSVLLFQLPRPTSQLSESYVTNAQSALQAVLPKGIQALILGNDVKVYELDPEIVTTLILKGTL